MIKTILLTAALLSAITFNSSAQQLEVVAEAAPQALCASGTATLSAYPATAGFSSAPLPPPQNRPVVTITFAEPVTAADFTIAKADLKYDKDFGYSIQVDDGLTHIVDYAFPLLEGGEVDGETLPGLYYTDGCGNDIPFKMATAHYSWNAFNDNDMHDPENGYHDLGDNGTITWDQVITLYQNGWGIYNHGFYDNGTAGGLGYTINRNHSYTRSNTHPQVPGGIEMNLFVIPASTTELGPVAIDNGYNQVLSANYSVGDPYYNINEDTYYNTQISRHFGNSTITPAVEQLAAAADEGIKALATTGTHQLSWQDFRVDLEQVEEDYGKSGTDQLWFATSEEIIQYLYVRDHVELNTQASGNTVTIELAGTLPDDLRFYALSLLVDSDIEITQVERIDGTIPNFNPDFNGTTLINLNWNERVIPTPQSLAEGFTIKAENSQDTYDALIAMDYAMMVEDTATQHYYLARLCAIPGVELPEGLCTGLPEYNWQWFANGEAFSDEPVIEVTPAETTTYSVVMTNGSEELTDETTVEVTDPPTVEVPEGQTLCPDESITLSAVAANYSAFSWLSSGDGTFSAPENPETAYLPGNADITSGEVTLYATAQSEGCDEASDSVTYQFFPAPSVVAPEDTSMCHDATLSLNISAENYNTVSWSTDGDGFFSEENGLSTAYTPGSQDIETGQVILTAVASEENCGAQATADITVEIIPSPEGNAGEPVAVCPGQETITLQGTGADYSNAYWQTNGAGVFATNGIVAEYEPVEGDFAMDNLVFELILEPQYPCSDNFTETIATSFIDPPEAEAGEDSMACYGIPFAVQGEVSNAADFYWSTSGNGYFIDENSLNTYYQFGTAFQQTGQVMLTLHALPEGDCELEAVSTITLTQTPLPEIYAGDNGEMCYTDTAYQLEGNVEGTDDFYWITQGDGTFSDTTVIDPLYFPGPQERETGVAYPGLKVGESVTCGTTISNDYLLLNIVQPPEADAGEDRITCPDEGAILSGNAIRHDSLIWITEGDGAFQEPHQLETTYIPGEEDNSGEPVALVLEAHSTTGCVAMDADTLWLTVEEELIVDAGEDQEICPEMPAFACSPDAENADSIYWSSSGTGTFSNPHEPNALYYISTEDRQQGSITLHLDAYAENTCNAETSGEFTLSFLPAPVVDAGADIAICGYQAVALNGSAQYADSILWETTGDGNFAESGIAQTTYYPGETDIMTGGADLILKASALPPCNTFRSDTAVISIETIPDFEVTATPGNIIAGQSSSLTSSVTDNVMINWDILSGNGYFSSWSGTNIIYYSALSDTTEPVQITAAASITGPCSTNLYDTATIYVTSPPVLFAGNDTAACETASHIDLNAAYEGDDNIVWSTQGDGYFEDPAVLNTAYYFGDDDYNNGTVTLHLSVENANYPEDDLVVDINPLPAISLPEISEGCTNQEVQIVAEGSDFSNIIWESDGDGDFTSASGLTATYQPGPEDAEAGEVQIWAQAQPLEGCEENATDTTTLLLAASPVAFAGEDQVSCSNEDILLNDASAENAGESQVLWSTSGSGTFEDASSLHTIYYPSGDDVASGEITLTLTVSSQSSCQDEDNDQMQVSFDPAPDITVAPPDTSCYGQEVNLTASASHYNSIAWESLSESTFSDNTGITATLVPAEADIQAGEALYRVSASGTGACSAQADTVYGTVTLIPEPEIDAGEDIASCGNNPVYLSGSVSAFSPGSIFWSTSGDGSFENGTLFNTYYYPGGQDIENGQVTLTLHATAPSPCNDTFTDVVMVDIQTAPQIPDAPYGDDLVCQGHPEVVLHTNAVENADAYLWLLLTENAGNFEEFITESPSNVLLLDDAFHGNYKVKVAAQNTCGISSYSEFFSGSVKQNPQVSIAASPSTEVCQGETILLDATTENAEEYFWYPGDFPNVPVIEVDSSGHLDGNKTMHVTATDVFGCSAADSIPLYFSVCTHNNTPEPDHTTLSPNPAKDHIRITSGHNATVTLYNHRGKVLESRFHRFEEENLLKLDLRPYPAGVYYIQLQGKRFSHVHKFIRVR